MRTRGSTVAVHQLLVIDAPHFYAGAIYDERNIVVRAAPIIKWSVGKSVAEVIAYCQRKRWKHYGPLA